MTGFEDAIACRVLQQCKSGRKIRKEIVALSTLFVTVVDGSNETSRSHVGEPRLSTPQTAMTGFNRLATCGMIAARQKLLMRVKRRCNGDVRQ
jgi:hypothetical protein